jgi:DNA-binding NarL/FixJ family response regulator
MGISVFVIDAERTFADALSARLEAEEDIDIVMSLHPKAPAPSLILGRHADVVLLDADLPESLAANLCEELASRAEAPRVVMMSSDSKANRIADAVRAGAAGWVRKDESLDHLLGVVRGVGGGDLAATG